MPEVIEGLTTRQLTDPKLLAAIAKLELKSRRVVEGMRSGFHKSPYKGFSVEFAQHRSYVPGDEIKYLDWKVFAKTDRYVIKEYEEETELRAHFCLDISKSMTYSSHTQSKLDVGRLIIASMAHLLIGQGDASGLALMSEKIHTFLPARGGFRHYRFMLEEMVGAQPGKDTNMGEAFHEVAEKVKRRGLIVIISDCFDDVDRLLVSLSHFRHRRHDVILFHVLDRFELTFPFEDMTLFQGLEPATPVLTEPWQVRQAYLEEMESFLTKLKKGCQDRVIDYVQILTDEPLDLALSRYLMSRKTR